MTITEMHRLLNLRVQKVNSNAFNSLQPEEIDVYLNEAISQFIKDRFEPRSNRFRLGFEQSVKRIEDLKNLIKTIEIDTLEVQQLLFDKIFTDKAPLPEDQFLTISVGLKIFFNDLGIPYSLVVGKRTPTGVLDTDYGEKRINGKFIQHDDIYAVFKDPFNKPKIQQGVFSIDNNNIYSYTNNKFITDKVILTYIRQPAKVSLTTSTDCDLSPNVHSEIVNIAVESILSDIGVLGSQKHIEDLTDIE